MQIVWQNEKLESQYAFRHQALWNGVRVHHAHVMPGKLLEYATEFHEINVSISGNLTTQRITATGKRKVYTNRGDGGICITPAGQTVSAFWEKPLDNLGILLAPDFVSKTAAENRFSSNFDFYDDFLGKDRLVKHIGLTLIEEYLNESPEGKLYAESLINTLTLHLLKNYSTARSISENTNGGLSGYKLRRVQEFINEKLDEDLSLSDIAEVADLSQFHFSRAFRKSTGLTPQQYLMQQRIERAKILLTKEDLPLIEVSLQTGFKNQSHFTTLFRKYTKLTPKLWREMKLA